jgi:hypothetical protein
MSVLPNIWPKYSFVQDSAVVTSNGIYPDKALNLPLSSWANLKCQVQVDGTEPLLILGAGPGSYSEIYLTPVAPDFPCSYDIESLLSGGFSHTHHGAIVDLFGIYDTGTSPYLYLYFDFPNDGGNMDDMTTGNNTIAVPVGSCFKFALVWDVYDSSHVHVWRFYYGCTNLFRRTAPGDSYTSVIAYANATGSGLSDPSDAFDFHYTGPNLTMGNVVELPCYLRDPTMPTSQKIYTRSDGSNVVLYQRKDEQYTLETDLLPYLWHKALDVALSHDYVAIYTPNANAFDPLNTATQFVKKDNYEIEYMKAPFSSLGKGSCKLLNAGPIHLINNNCG